MYVNALNLIIFSYKASSFIKINTLKNSIYWLEMKILIIFTFILFEILSRKLIFVQNLFRHGARYPVFVNDDDFTNEPRIVNNKG